MEKGKYKQPVTLVIRSSLILCLLFSFASLYGQNKFPNKVSNLQKCQYGIYYHKEIKENLIFYKDTLSEIHLLPLYLGRHFKLGNVIFKYREERIGSTPEKFLIYLEGVKLIHENCSIRIVTLKSVELTVIFDDVIRSKLGNSIPFDKKKYIATENLIKSCRAKFKKNKLIFKIGRGLFKKRKVIFIDSNNYYKMPELIESFIKEKIKLDDYWINFKSTVELGRKMGSNLIIKDNKD